MFLLQVATKMQDQQVKHQQSKDRKEEDLSVLFQAYGQLSGPRDVTEVGLELKCSVRDETRTFNLWGEEDRPVSNMERKTVSFGEA